MPKLNLPAHKKTLTREIHRATKLVKKFFSLKIVVITIMLLFVISIIPVAYFLKHRPVVHPDINYGITFSDKYATEIGLNWRETYIKILDELRPQNVRLVAYWDDVEREKDQYNYENVRWQIEEAQKRNVNVMLVVGRKVPRWPECFEPQWWKDTQDEDLKNHELFEFVKNTVTEMRQYSAIKFWQVENEPFFPFGNCNPLVTRDVLKQEIKIVRSLDDRPIIIQDSGEGGFWYPTYSLGDYLAISMYRKIWYDFWGIFFGKPIYFKYPLAHWTYKIKADITQVPADKIKVTELQAEPWGPTINSELTEEQKNKTMSKNDFLDTISYAQKSGFQDLYFWGAEWWLWEKEVNGNPFYWDTASSLFNH